MRFTPISDDIPKDAARCDLTLAVTDAHSHPDRGCLTTNAVINPHPALTAFHPATVDALDYECPLRADNNVHIASGQQGPRTQFCTQMPEESGSAADPYQCQPHRCDRQDRG